MCVIDSLSPSPSQNNTDSQKGSYKFSRRHTKAMTPATYVIANIETAKCRGREALYSTFSRDSRVLEIHWSSWPQKFLLGFKYNHSWSGGCALLSPSLMSCLYGKVRLKHPSETRFIRPLFGNNDVMHVEAQPYRFLALNSTDILRTNEPRSNMISDK